MTFGKQNNACLIVLFKKKFIIKSVALKSTWLNTQT